MEFAVLQTACERILFSLCKICDMLYGIEYVSLYICRNEKSCNVFGSKQATLGQATCLSK